MHIVDFNLPQQKPYVKVKHTLMLLVAQVVNACGNRREI